MNEWMSCRISDDTDKDISSRLKYKFNSSYDLAINWVAACPCFPRRHFLQTIAGVMEPIHSSHTCSQILAQHHHHHQDKARQGKESGV